MPGGWRDAIAVIAFVFHFPPSELWEFGPSEIVFWIEQANRIRAEQHG